MYRRHLFKLSELEPENAEITWHTATEYDTYLALRLSYRYALKKSWEVSAGFSVGAHLFKTNYKDEGVIPQKKTDIFQGMRCFVGTRYMVTKHFGFFIDAGFPYYVSGGVSLRL